MTAEMTERRCGNCRFYDSLCGQICRRHPPMPTISRTYWPSVHHNDWCGEWTPKEESERGG